MPFTLTSVIIDAADIETEGAFWHRLLGGSTTTTPTHHFIQAPDLPVIVIQSAPDHTAPDWPNGTPSRCTSTSPSKTSQPPTAPLPTPAPRACAPQRRPPPTPAAASTPAPPDIPSASARPETAIAQRSACHEYGDGNRCRHPSNPEEIRSPRQLTTGS